MLSKCFPFDDILDLMIYLTFIKSKRGILFNNHCFPVTISFLLDLNSKTLQSLLAGTLNESTARSLFCNDARNKKKKAETEKKRKKRTITKFYPKVEQYSRGLTAKDTAFKLIWHSLCYRPRKKWNFTMPIVSCLSGGKVSAIFIQEMYHCFFWGFLISMFKLLLGKIYVQRRSTTKYQVRRMEKWNSRTNFISNSKFVATVPVSCKSTVGIEIFIL